MSIYIYKNNHQSGPFEEEQVSKMLEDGQLSPSDMAIRRGQSQWQPLGRLFPHLTGRAVPFAGAAAEQKPAEEGFPPANPIRAATATISRDDQNAVKAGKQPSGFRRISGVLMIVFGVLSLLGGIGMIVASFTLQEPFACQSADRYRQQMDEAYQKYQREKTPQNAKAVEEASTGVEIFSKSCGEQLDLRRWWMIGFIAAAIFGLILTIAGIFLRR